MCMYEVSINCSMFSSPGDAERQREEHVDQEAVEVEGLVHNANTCIFSFFSFYGLVYNCHSRVNGYPKYWMVHEFYLSVNPYFQIVPTEIQHIVFNTLR